MRKFGSPYLHSTKNTLPFFISPLVILHMSLVPLMSMDSILRGVWGARLFLSSSFSFCLTGSFSAMFCNGKLSRFEPSICYCKPFSVLLFIPKFCPTTISWLFLSLRTPMNLSSQSFQESFNIPRKWICILPLFSPIGTLPRGKQFRMGLRIWFLTCLRFAFKGKCNIAGFYSLSTCIFYSVIGTQMALVNIGKKWQVIC